MSNKEKAIMKSASASKSRKRTSSEINGDKDYIPIEKSSGPVQRVWSHAAEIKLLEALRAQTNRSDMAMLFDTVNKCLNFDVTKKQLADKVRKLKAKFKDISEGKKVAGSDEHSTSLYKLSLQVWGGCEDDKEEAEEDDDDGIRVLKEKYPHVNRLLASMYPDINVRKVGLKILKNYIRRMLIKFLSREELEEMEQEWVEFELEELERGHRCMKLVKKHMKLIEKVDCLAKEQE